MSRPTLFRALLLSVLATAATRAAEFRFQPGDEFSTATTVRVQIDKNNTGTAPLSLGGRTFLRGIGTHAKDFADWADAAFTVQGIASVIRAVQKH